MQSRVLIFLAVTLLLLMAAWSLVPPAEEPAPPSQEPAPGEAVEPPPPFRPDAGEPIRLELDAAQAGAEAGSGERSDDRKEVETVGLDEHVLIEVSVPTPGQVQIEGLGRQEFASPLTPATFDLLADQQGRFDVVYTPTGGEQRSVGTVVVRAGAVG